ncbi:helix-turn-helix domain-containing protein [Aquidulcibacter sp.]|uniref:helix-turn-helix domain-containing protein n=1 Tax=Aquidulcibacter sp. TaxID=2052990 RepID=UPI0025C6CFBA|nr:helix-turn-helix domain-containing protein [Aquidulcibacter sp.]MCA3695106.1 helix-turn-helix domain-containing protein [Aquidulcibacter sp.]
MLADQSYTVVQHAGQGLVVLPESAFRNVLQSTKKLQGAKAKPKVHLLNGREVMRILEAQRAEVAAELPERERANHARPRQGLTIVRNNNRRVEVLKIISRSTSGMTRDQISELGGMPISAVYTMLLRLLKLGLVVNVEGTMPKRVMISPAGRGMI